MIWMWIARWVVRADCLVPFLAVELRLQPVAHLQISFVERTMAPKQEHFCSISWCCIGAEGFVRSIEFLAAKLKIQASFSCLPFLAANSSKSSIFSEAWKFRLGKMTCLECLVGRGPLRLTWYDLPPACISPNCGACTSPRPFQMRSTAPYCHFTWIFPHLLMHLRFT